MAAEEEERGEDASGASMSARALQARYELQPGSAPVERTWIGLMFMMPVVPARGRVEASSFQVVRHQRSSSQPSSPC